MNDYHRKEDNIMKTKSFAEYAKKRLTKEEIEEIDKEAELEVQFLKSMQMMISVVVNDYMEKNKIGFNELVRRLESSPSHVAKMQRGEANLTLSTFAHLCARMGKEPQEIFKSRYFHKA